MLDLLCASETSSCRDGHQDHAAQCKLICDLHVCHTRTDAGHIQMVHLQDSAVACCESPEAR